MNDIAKKVLQLMQPTLNNAQSERLKKVLDYCFFELESEDCGLVSINNAEYLNRFIAAKRLEGCSERSLKYYRITIHHLLDGINKPICEASTEDIRSYLSSYQASSQAGHVTLDNIRRIISSFFSWLEDEDYVIKSPVRRIKKVKSPQPVKDVYSDEDIEILRDNCGSARNLAVVDLLRSTGMRVGELVKLDRTSVDMQKRECIVLGKGNKERIVYFDARAKVHLTSYLESRTDNNDALFVSLLAPHERLQISGVESMLRNLGVLLGIKKVHPHKFRRTLATRAIDKGMPIEQVQLLLGHKKIDTTLRYAMVDQRNVKASHQRFLS